MSKTTVAKAATWMAPKLGLEWPKDRQEIIDNINRFRELLYSEYDDLKLFDDYQVCLCLNQFSIACGSLCCGGKTYTGFTLPHDMAGVLGVWRYGQAIHSLRSKWREIYAGITSNNTSEFEVVEVPGSFPIEREIKRHGKLKMFYEGNTPGLAANLLAKDPQGFEQTLTFELEPDEWVEVDFDVCQVLSVTLPECMDAPITLAQAEDGYELSIYVPGEIIPCYRRYKLSGTCPTGNVRVQGTRTYMPVFYDDDVLEVGSRLLIEAMGTYFRHYESQEQRELNVAQAALERAVNIITGNKARERGNMKRDDSAFKIEGPGRCLSPLPGYGSRRRRYRH